jgi:predicted lipoprotein with Yx(FWY)xxD motif
MTPSRALKFLAGSAVVPLAALSLAACGGDSGAAAATPPPKTASGAPATVGISNTGLGNILVNSQGHTLYLFTSDTGTKSTCSGACAANWPPLRANGKPTVGRGADAGLLGTTPRSDGKPQVTYNGHPVYLYQGDKKAGDTNGQALDAFGGPWYALTPAGAQVTSQPTGGVGGY